VRPAGSFGRGVGAYRDPRRRCNDRMMRRWVAPPTAMAANGRTTTTPPFDLSFPLPQGRSVVTSLLWPGGPSTAPGHGGWLCSLAAGFGVGVGFGVGCGLGFGVGWGVG
jgi:hypothetical protein